MVGLLVQVSTATMPRAGACAIEQSLLNVVPKYSLYIPTEVSPSDSFAAAGDIVISPDGRMFSDSFPLSESEAFTSLAGISCPVGS